MRSIKHALSAAVLMLGLTAGAHASDDVAAKKEADAPKKLKNQTHCPVMGGEIDSTAYTDIQGQRVYHCCPMCSEKLKADPDKYFKEAAAQGILFENIQTACPVSGKELQNKDTYVDYEGRRVVFCCPNCIPTFKEDPAKYLKKLDEASKGESSKMEMKEEMEGMNHGSHSH